MPTAETLSVSGLSPVVSMSKTITEAMALTWVGLGREFRQLIVGLEGWKWQGFGFVIPTQGSQSRQSSGWSLFLTPLLLTSFLRLKVGWELTQSRTDSVSGSSELSGGRFGNLSGLRHN